MALAFLFLSLRATETEEREWEHRNGRDFGVRPVSVASLRLYIYINIYRAML